MKEFLLLYRADESILTEMAMRSPEEMQRNMQYWIDWIGGIAAQNKLSDRGNRLTPSGKVVQPDNVIADGPYMEIKECVIGYTVVKGSSMEEATEIAKGCPVLMIGGKVEVREISVL